MYIIPFFNHLHTAFFLSTILTFVSTCAMYVPGTQVHILAWHISGDSANLSRMTCWFSVTFVVTFVVTSWSPSLPFHIATISFFLWNVTKTPNESGTEKSVAL